MVAWEPARVFCVLSTASTALFVLCLPGKLYQLYRSSTKIVPRTRGTLEVAFGLLLSAVLLFCVTRYLLPSGQHETVFALSILASFIASLGLTMLMILEQRRASGPSDIVTVYLISSILCDLVLLCTRSQLSMNPEVLHTAQLRCLAHAVTLIVENLPCRSALNTTNHSNSPEESSGILSRIFFTWINPILLRGYRNILVDQDLPCLSEELKPELTRARILYTWSQRAKPESRKALPLALLKCIMKPFLGAIISRLFLITFRYSQPALIKQSIRYVTLPTSDIGRFYGEWLIISALAIYLGLAVSRSIYQHRLNRLKLMTRSALVGLIHDKTMRSPGIAYDDGESTTLMSTDADSLDDFAEIIHETWAQVIEVVIGIYLLAIEVGWIWPLPLVLIFLCSHVSRYVATHLGPLQKAWNKATQSRVAVTSSMLSSMKIIKMLGFQQSITSRIEELRKEELSEAAKLRWVRFYYNASANALGLFSPAITLVIFAVISRAHGHSLDTETAFTTIAILSMITHPANMVMTIVPRAVASFAGFDRIQTFLLRPSLHDEREILSHVTAMSLPLKTTSVQLTRKEDPAIELQKLKLGNKQVILKNINIEIAEGSIFIVTGPTGSGKSTLLRAILGEIPPSEGVIKLSTQRIAYCAQKPWLPSGNIRDVIYGSIPKCSEDEGWYNQVLDMCCLTHDIDTLPEGDQTQIGSRGLNLSGGQRQRVALARALAHALNTSCNIILLDDCFSGLDGETEAKIFGNLFGPLGLLRQLKSTVVLVSNSTQYFKTADQILVLDDHEIKEQGTWKEIKVKAPNIAKFTVGSNNKNNLFLAADVILSAQTRGTDEAEDDLSRQTGDFSLYAYYLRHIRLVNTLLLIGFSASCSFFMMIPQYWLQIWTESRDKNSMFWIYGFLALAVMAWLTTNGIMWSIIIRIAPESGMRLHQRLLHVVTSAPLLYFSKTDNGSILNRFSQDIQLIDKQLPFAFQNLLVQIFKLLMQAALLFVAQKWLLSSFPACIIIVYLVQKVYLRTSRQLRFLELEARAAVFSSFLESTEGLETIRAFGWTQQVIQDNIGAIDNSQRPEFLLFCLQRWLNVVLDLLSAAIATSVVITAVLFRQRVSGGQVGIALNIMLVANTTLLKLVGEWTTLEISLGAVARLKMLEQNILPMRERDGNFEPPDNWPSRGHIMFKNVTASYNANSAAIKSLNLNIDAGQKVIICGRTGSGKSTLLLTLLRLLELQSGTIELDGVDIGQVRLDLLRQRSFITVSQDTLLLSNETLRFNLDPNAALPEHIIIDALLRVGLWAQFNRKVTDESVHAGYGTIDNSVSGEHPILDKKMSEFQDLSGGQAQLFGLCRALIHAAALSSAGVKPVVLLDEVTSSLDPATESKIYSIVEDELSSKGHTVIVVAHRLGGLTERAKPGRDVVAFMRGGRLQEVITDLSHLGSKNLEETE